MAKRIRTINTESLQKPLKLAVVGMSNILPIRLQNKLHSW